MEPVDRPQNPCYEAFFSAFSIIKDLRQQGFGQQPVQVIDELVPFVQDKLGFPIHLHGRKWAGDQVFGALLRYSDRAEIIYSQGLNTCWRRFVVAKELAHLLFDDSRTYTKDPEVLISGLLNFSAQSDVSPLAEVTSERLAVIMATELILPRTERERIFDLHAGGQSSLKIASEYSAPARVVECFLSKTYDDLAQSCWGLVERY